MGTKNLYVKKENEMKNEILSKLEEREKDMRYIFNCYGEITQTLKTIEELTECLKAINDDVQAQIAKYGILNEKDGVDLTSDTYSEIADAFIMLFQLSSVDTPAIAAEIERKINRTLNLHTKTDTMKRIEDILKENSRTFDDLVMVSYSGIMMPWEDFREQVEKIETSGVKFKIPCGTAILGLNFWLGNTFNLESTETFWTFQAHIPFCLAKVDFIIEDELLNLKTKRSKGDKEEIPCFDGNQDFTTDIASKYAFCIERNKAKRLLRKHV